MFCLIISLTTLALGIWYLFAGYELATGYMQILVGIVSTVLCIMWLVTKNKAKNEKQAHSTAPTE